VAQVRAVRPEGEAVTSHYAVHRATACQAMTQLRRKYHTAARVRDRILAASALASICAPRELVHRALFPYDTDDRLFNANMVLELLIAEAWNIQ
jgi:hypothetical protein